jgi:hypothetical protein
VRAECRASNGPRIILVLREWECALDFIGRHRNATSAMAKGEEDLALFSGSVA